MNPKLTTALAVLLMCISAEVYIYKLLLSPRSVDIIKLICSFTQLPASEASYKFELHIQSFLNPNHEHIIYEEVCGLSGWNWVCSNVWNDYCCESFFTSGCSSQCDNYFEFCLRNLEDVGNDNIDYCPLGSHGPSNHISNSDDVTFGNDIGGVPNPMPFVGTIWPVSIL